MAKGIRNKGPAMHGTTTNNKVVFPWAKTWIQPLGIWANKSSRS